MGKVVGLSQNSSVMLGHCPVVIQKDLLPFLLLNVNVVALELKVVTR